MRVLFLGDIVGRPGRNACIAKVHELRRELELDAVVANGENASGGTGLSVKNAGELLSAGIDLLTGGNHIWKQKDYIELFEKFPNVIRPANYPDNAPGKGWGVVETQSGEPVAVINLQGRVFMEPIDCPFLAADRILPEISKIARIVIVDFHAEATSEKVAMGIYLDGRVSAVFGTHTHIPSADERILPGGTAFQTDIGMVGPMNGILGVDSESVIRKFLTGLPARFSVADGPVEIDGVIVDFDPSDGKAKSIERLRLTDIEVSKEKTKVPGDGV
ncbi:MAG TPA: TIGR00282 family metallophosphoesterase [Firmicutes bacterium]|nr:TIGR00282 family metallophosphoesterase [Bacillota bacterium]